jgi:hypothetical protein
MTAVVNFAPVIQQSTAYTCTNTRQDSYIASAEEAENVLLLSFRTNRHLPGIMRFAVFPF